MMVEAPLDVRVRALRITALGPVKVVPPAADGIAGEGGAWPIPPWSRIPPAAVIISERSRAMGTARPHIFPFVRKAGRLEVGRRVNYGKRGAGSRPLRQ